MYCRLFSEERRCEWRKSDSDQAIANTKRKGLSRRFYGGRSSSLVTVDRLLSPRDSNSVEGGPQDRLAIIGRTMNRVDSDDHSRIWPERQVLSNLMGALIHDTVQGPVAIVGSANHRVSEALSPVPALLTVAIFVILARQPVIGADAQQVNRPILIAAVVTAVSGLIIDQTVLPHHFTGWLVLLAAGVAVPWRGVALAAAVTVSSHPRARLDDVIHAPVRVSIMAALAVADRIDFGYLRELLEVSDCLLSKHT